MQYWALRVSFAKLREKGLYLKSWMHSGDEVVPSPKDAHVIRRDAFECGTQEMMKKLHDEQGIPIRSE